LDLALLALLALLHQLLALKQAVEKHSIMLGPEAKAEAEAEAEEERLLEKYALVLSL